MGHEYFNRIKTRLKMEKFGLLSIQFPLPALQQNLFVRALTKNQKTEKKHP